MLPPKRQPDDGWRRPGCAFTESDLCPSPSFCSDLAAPRLYLSPPHLGGHELNYLSKALADGWIAPAGPHLPAFEAELVAELGGTDEAGRPLHAIALSSGTAALHVALRLLDVGPGDEVVCASFTFAASAGPILYLGATPVFVDSEAQTWNMAPAALRECLAARRRLGKRVKAVIVVDLYGMPADLDALLAIAAEFDVPVIEDAAEALGSTLHGRPLGTRAAMSIFSFNGNKIITTSGGGALVTADPALAARALHLATQAKEAAAHYEHVEIGYNYRLSNLLAGVGRAQLEVLPDRVKARRWIHRQYREKLRFLDFLEFGPDEPSGFCSNRWLTTILLDPAVAPDHSPEHLRQHLERFNIEARPLWKPLHRQPVFKDALYYDHGGTADGLFARGLCLPSGSAMKEPELDRVATAVMRF